MAAPPAEAPPRFRIAILDAMADQAERLKRITLALWPVATVDTWQWPAELVEGHRDLEYDFLIIDPFLFPKSGAASLLPKLRAGELADKVILCSAHNSVEDFPFGEEYADWISSLPWIDKTLDDRSIAQLLTAIAVDPEMEVNPAVEIGERQPRAGIAVLSHNAATERLINIFELLQSTYDLGSILRFSRPIYGEIRDAWPKVMVLNQTEPEAPDLAAILHFGAINGVSLIRFGTHGAIPHALIPADTSWFQQAPVIDPRLSEMELLKVTAGALSAVNHLLPRSSARQPQPNTPHAGVTAAPAASPSGTRKKAAPKKAPRRKGGVSGDVAVEPRPNTTPEPALPTQAVTGMPEEPQRQAKGLDEIQQQAVFLGTAARLADGGETNVGASNTVETPSVEPLPNAPIQQQVQPQVRKGGDASTGAGLEAAEEEDDGEPRQRIHEVAEELGIESRRLLGVLRSLGADVTSASATFPAEYGEAAAERLRLDRALQGLAQGVPATEFEELLRTLRIWPSAREVLGYALAYGRELDSLALLGGIGVAGRRDPFDTAGIVADCLTSGREGAGDGRSVARQLELAGVEDDPAEPRDVPLWEWPATPDLWRTMSEAFRIVQRVSRPRPLHERNEISARHLAAAILVADPPVAANERLRALGYDVADMREQLLGRIYARSVNDDLAAWARILTPNGAAPPRFEDEPLAIAHEPDAPQGRKDQLDITREVNAMCALLAAESTKPPLSVGLFGDWGAGKSFFMGKMQKRISRLARTARDDDAAGRPPVYCRRIAQITFNAWHYMDANLWASLVTRVFEGLAEHLAPRTDEVEALRAELVGKLAANHAELARVETQRAKAQATEQEYAEKLGSLADEEAEIQRELDSLPTRVRAMWEAVREEPEVKGLIDGAIAEMKGIALQVDETGLPEQVAELKQVGADFRLGLQALRANRRWFGAVVALCVILAVGFAAWSITASERQQGVTAFLTAAAALAAPIAAFNRALEPWRERIRRGRALLERANERLNQRHQALRDDLARQEAARRAELDDKRRQTAELQRREAEVKAEIKRLEAEMDEIRAGRRMERFIVERSGSDEYRRHLGIVALIRRDFERLGELLSQVRTERGQGADVERIVLYIDDLDRCPEDRVVEVLQAVHLLLAFPLFVVVVGVDSRWLLRSLKQHYAMADVDRRDDRERPRDEDDGDDDDIWESTPHSYLEKIFQIPFTLRPMDHTGFGRLVAGLLDGTSDDAPVEDDPDADLRGAPIAAPPAEIDTKEEGRILAIRLAPPEDKVSDAEPAGGPDAPPEGEAGDDVSAQDVSRDESEEDTGDTEPADERDDAAEAEGGVTYDIVADMEPAADAQPDDADHAEDGDADAEEADGGAVVGTVQAMAISPEEVAFIKLLSPLIRSPRAANRFVNVYRFIRAGMTEEEMRRFRGSGHGRPGEFRVVALLLALVTGFPWQAGELLEEIEAAEDAAGLRWSDVRRKVRSRASADPRPAAGSGNGDAPAEGDAPRSGDDDVPVRRDARRWRELDAALAEVERYTADVRMPADLSAYARWAGHVGRFSFHTGHVITRRRA